MEHSWNDSDIQDLWTLTIDESALLPGMTDKGRFGFAVQLKFMEMHGRFPEHQDEVDPNATQWLAKQLGTTTESLSSYEFGGRQGQRHRRTIRVFLGFRRATGIDLQQLVQWLCDDVTHKPIMDTTWRSTGVAHNTWNHQPAITWIASSDLPCMVTRGDSWRPFICG